MKAAKIYKALAKEGWEATLLEFHPGYESRGEKPLTVGDFIEEVAALSSTAPKSFGDYCRSFRRIVSDIAGLKTGKSRYDYKGGGRERWAEKVNSILLERVTPDAVERWRHEYVAQALSPEEIRRKKTSANSTIRQAKALFAKKVMTRLMGRVNLPEELPFEGVGMFSRKECSPKRYRSKVDAAHLIRSASTDLGAGRRTGENPEEFELRREQYKAFLLAI